MEKEDYGDIAETSKTSALAIASNMLRQAMASQFFYGNFTTIELMK